MSQRRDTAKLHQFSITRQDLALACEQTSTLGETENIRFSRVMNGGGLLMVTWREKSKQAGVVIDHGRVVKAEE